MKWPWVSRALADVLTADLERARRDLEFSQAVAQAGQERYERLVERTITMQRDGFEVVKPPVEDEPAKPFSDVIEQAIADRAHDSISDRRLRQYAAAAMAVPKATPEAVAARILAGETLDEEYAI